MFGCLTCDDNFNYYMDQSRMITFIVLEANLPGAADEHLPYPPVRLNTRCHLLAFAAKVEKQLQATVSIQRAIE